MVARRAHNPEVVGSSPASATIKSPEIVRFQDFSCVLGVKKFKENLCDFLQNRLTHILTHNRIAPGGQVGIFQNTMSTKSEKPRNFQNFLKSFFCDLRVWCDVSNPLLLPATGNRRGFLFDLFCYIPCRKGRY